MLEPAHISRFLTRLLVLLFAVTITLVISRPYPSDPAATCTATLPDEPNQPTQTDTTNIKSDAIASCIFIPHSDAVSPRCTLELEPEPPRGAGAKSTPEGVDGSTERKRPKLLPRNSRWGKGSGSMANDRPFS